MKLPQDFENRSGSGPSFASVILGVSIFVLFVLIAVLFVNRDKRSSVSSEKPEVQQTADRGEEIQGGQDNGSGLTDGSVEKLEPDDLDFWEMYPEEKEDEKNQEEKPDSDRKEEVRESDVKTDGKHTRIVYEDGREEWVLINPYLPKHDYDFNSLVCQSDRMKYYEDGRLESFVGVELSRHQDYVDFHKMRKDGIDFVMLRVGLRGYGDGQIMKDDAFDENIKRASEAGLGTGVYFSSQAVTKEEAEEEAELVLESIRDYDVKYPVVFDMEHVENDAARIDGLSREEKTAIAGAFLRKIEEQGYHAMIYGNKEWLIKEIDLTRLTDYDIWYSGQEDIPDFPYRFSMWEYTGNGVVDGVAGYSDLSICFIDYEEK